ncbi:MAG TPA: TRAP transporter substrate-binding protein [Methylococcaceae bacterium]|jgi:TRAP-type mannitol/chloroaromatic compound transport system substrate-binding protein|nr:TRAP transporter substrate-binding protein [Methylococcaceae bacterium]HIA45710.1 TRAP transporter substrate-binding protein [Methylococcaceae bacterium]HIB62086.1 TRAP transporter substrate-binding protein [Methylococcaceae bacterium]HIN68956.1 TRAP transporter substrate-binding protein [Methylococcales bacterium]HIO13240.1 TRAP transporter substrate-binding protein [Methylococcales bacterium]
MKRRNFMVAAGASPLLAAMPTVVNAKAEFRWKMVTAWPKNFPGLGTNANLLAQMINTMSGGRIKIKVYGAKELVPAFEVFDAVSNGVAELGHSGAYYWKGKSATTQFFSAVPFGLTAQEMNSWLYYGGGMELWRELYQPFGIIPAATGNSGVQMAGWFNREINSFEDLSGLKMRMPGLGGEVLRRAGGTTVNIPGGELFTALQTGTLDATEWVGPYNDLAFGLHKVAKYYYYPGWHEPGSTMECLINEKAFNSLPKDLQEIILVACKAANLDMLSEYTARNHQALKILVDEHGVKVMALPDEVLKRLLALSVDVVAELADSDAMARRVYDSVMNFKQQVSAWHALSEQAFLRARAL